MFSIYASVNMHANVRKSVPSSYFTLQHSRLKRTVAIFFVLCLKKIESSSKTMLTSVPEAANQYLNSSLNFFPFNSRMTNHCFQKKTVLSKLFDINSTQQKIFSIHLLFLARMLCLKIISIKLIQKDLDTKTKTQQLYKKVVLTNVLLFSEVCIEFYMTEIIKNYRYTASRWQFLTKAKNLFLQTTVPFQLVLCRMMNMGINCTI